MASAEHEPHGRSLVLQVREGYVGARIEAPKPPREVRCGEGVSPSPPEVGSG